MAKNEEFELTVVVPRVLTQRMEIIDPVMYTKESIVRGLKNGVLRYAGDDFNGYIHCRAGLTVAHTVTFSDTPGEATYILV